MYVIQHVMLFNAHHVLLRCCFSLFSLSPSLSPSVSVHFSFCFSLIVVHVMILLAYVSGCGNCYWYGMYQCLLFRLVSAPGNGSAVLLTDPAQVAHELHDHYMRKELPPQGGEQGVTNWSRRSYCCCLLVQVPDLVFHSAAGEEELDIRPLVPRNLARKDHCIGLYIVNRYGMRVIVSVHVPILIFLPV